jgi:NAD(P)-dependent dehydrogenase (short-subunit alcohol dehydrogenase family)
VSDERDLRSPEDAPIDAETPSRRFMNERVMVITGASDGIGAAAARLAKAEGHHVVIVGRSPNKTKAVADELDSPFFIADFSRFDDVRTLGRQLHDHFPRIDVLANNAGGVMGPRTLTVDGNERTLQVNHLSPFLLTNLLLDTLISSRASVIETASVANRWSGRLDLSDMTLERHYSSMRAYAKAKLMNFLLAKGLHQRFHDAGLSAAAFHPGVARTSFSTEFGGTLNLAYTSLVKHLFRLPVKGAETLVWLATTTPGSDWQSGAFYKDKKIYRVGKQAYDRDLAADLWELSAKLTGIA